MGGGIAPWPPLATPMNMRLKNMSFAMLKFVSEGSWVNPPTFQVDLGVLMTIYNAITLRGVLNFHSKPKNTKV